MREIQTRAVKIISEAFKSTFEATLNVELHLLSMQNNLNIALYDALLRIIIGSAYVAIKKQRTLSNRQLLLDQTQHQNSLYAQLSFLHKLKIRYAVVFNRNLIKLKLRILFSCVL